MKSIQVLAGCSGQDGRVDPPSLTPSPASPPVYDRRPPPPPLDFTRLFFFFISESKLLGLPCEFLRPAGCRSHAGGMGRPVRACLCMLAPRRSPLCWGPFCRVCLGNRVGRDEDVTGGSCCLLFLSLPSKTKRCRFDETKQVTASGDLHAKLLIAKIVAWCLCLTGRETFWLQFLLLLCLSSC